MGQVSIGTEFHKHVNHILLRPVFITVEPHDVGMGQSWKDFEDIDLSLVILFSLNNFDGNNFIFGFPPAFVYLSEGSFSYFGIRNYEKVIVDFRHFGLIEFKIRHWL